MNERKFPDVTRPLRPPSGWGADHLSAFIETAHRNRFATFANKRVWFQRLQGIDDCFMRVARIG
jgi:hypothetical protein